MSSSNPHVAIVVDNTDETPQFFASSRSVNLEDGFNLLCERLNSFASNPVALVLHIITIYMKTTSNVCISLAAPMHMFDYLKGKVCQIT